MHFSNAKLLTSRSSMLARTSSSRKLLSRCQSVLTSCESQAIKCVSTKVSVIPSNSSGLRMHRSPFMKRSVFSTLSDIALAKPDPVSSNDRKWTPQLTKIVSTIGPTSEQFPVLQDLVRSGVRIMRLNFSHATVEEVELRVKNLRLCEVRQFVNLTLNTQYVCYTPTHLLNCISRAYRVSMAQIYHRLMIKMCVPCYSTRVAQRFVWASSVVTTQVMKRFS